MTPAELREVEALAAQADAGEAPAGAAGGAQAPALQDAALSLGAEISGVLQAVSGMLAPVFPSLSAIYTPGACQGAGAAIEAVCNKHGWLQGGLMGKWGEEIAAAAVLAPLAFATYQGVRRDLAAREAPPAEQPGAKADMAP